MPLPPADKSWGWQRGLEPLLGSYNSRPDFCRWGAAVLGPHITFPSPGLPSLYLLPGGRVSLTRQSHLPWGRREPQDPCPSALFGLEEVNLLVHGFRVQSGMRWWRWLLLPPITGRKRTHQGANPAPKGRQDACQLLHGPCRPEP